ncbi:MAG: SDR family NAD(P)-dependent oxidoreductase [Deinococcota bacterium]
MTGQQARQQQIENPFADNVALVTGAGSGIGRAVAHALAVKGALVIASDVSLDAAKCVANEICAQQGDATALELDVASETSVQDAFNSIIKKHQRLDILVNNAGITGPGMTLTATYPTENWQEVININLNGVFWCLRAGLQQMLTQHAGNIVNVASIAGLRAMRGAAAYVASKHAVLGLTKAAAAEYASEGIRVNAVCPGVIDTPATKHTLEAMGQPHLAEQLARAHPIGRLGTAEEVAEAVTWLCLPAASFVTGHALAVDGGITTI